MALNVINQLFNYLASTRKESRLQAQPDNPQARACSPLPSVPSQGSGVGLSRSPDATDSPASASWKELGTLFPKRAGTENNE